MAEEKSFGDLSAISLDPFVDQLLLLLLFPEGCPMVERKGDKQSWNEQRLENFPFCVCPRV